MCGQGENDKDMMMIGGGGEEGVQETKSQSKESGTSHLNKVVSFRQYAFPKYSMSI